jgi:sulfopyruvate decarboxylase alpha subunit
MTAPPWPDEVYATLRRRGTSQFCYVPDSGHKRLIELAHADSEVRAIPLTTEEEGVGVVAGAHLGLARAVLLMQSSGVGNCVNFLSLIQHCRFPFLTLVTMRGEFGEQNPWQFAMGRAVEPVFGAMGVAVCRADGPEDVLPAVTAAIGMVDRGGQAVAVLLGQRLLGAKAFGPPA